MSRIQHLDDAINRRLIQKDGELLRAALVGALAKELQNEKKLSFPVADMDALTPFFDAADATDSPGNLLRLPSPARIESLAERHGIDIFELADPEAMALKALELIRADHRSTSPLGLKRG